MLYISIIHIKNLTPLLYLLISCMPARLTSPKIISIRWIYFASQKLSYHVMLCPKPLFLLDLSNLLRPYHIENRAYLVHSDRYFEFWLRILSLLFCFLWTVLKHYTLILVVSNPCKAWTCLHLIRTLIIAVYNMRVLRHFAPWKYFV